MAGLSNGLTFPLALRAHHSLPLLLPLPLQAQHPLSLARLDSRGIETKISAAHQNIHYSQHPSLNLHHAGHAEGVRDGLPATR